MRKEIDFPGVWFGSRENNRGLLKAFHCLNNCEYGKEELFEAFYYLNNSEQRKKWITWSVLPLK